MNLLKKVAVNILAFILSLFFVLVLLFVIPAYYTEDLNYLVGTYIVAIVVGIVTLIFLKLVKKIGITKKSLILFLTFNIILAEILFIFPPFFDTRDYYTRLYDYRSKYEQASKVSFQGENKIVVENIYLNLPPKWKVEKIVKYDEDYWFSVFEPSFFQGSRRYVGVYNLDLDQVWIKSVSDIWQYVKKTNNLPDTQKYSFEDGIKYVNFVVGSKFYFVELIPQNGQLSISIKDVPPPKGKW